MEKIKYIIQYLGKDGQWHSILGPSSFEAEYDDLEYAKMSLELFRVKRIGGLIDVTAPIEKFRLMQKMIVYKEIDA